MNKDLRKALLKVANLNKAGLTIYDNIEVGDNELWITSIELENLLNNKIIGISLKGLPLRTRSKVAKSIICETLGYPVPKSFKKTKPRFLGLKFDTYTQKSNNLQVWNEDLDPIRRYVIIKIDESDIIEKVKVVTGNELALLDTTGTLTQKYQARLQNIDNTFELISEFDTENIGKLCGADHTTEFKGLKPLEDPIESNLLPIALIYEKLKKVVGCKFPDPGSVQERNRGAELHKLVCKELGYSTYKDNGRFPDVRAQLLEIKLQTSPTIDLGLVSPDSETPLDMEKINQTSVQHCDIRYAIFYASIVNGIVEISNLMITNGQDFFSRFPKFAGKGLNKKIQIPLPTSFYKSNHG